MMRNKKGITLIALIITVIVLLILAGVSLNALVGDNGVISNSMRAKIKTELGGYKEEMEFSIFKVNSDDNSLDEKKTISAFGSYVKNYIPSLPDSQIGEFAIIESKLWYLGEDEEIREAAISQNINVIPADEDKNDYSKELEEQAIFATIASDGEKLFEKTQANGEKVKVGEPLKDKEGLNATDWKLVTEVSNGALVATYGTGWIYVPEGETIDAFGKLKNSYILNFEERKAVKFDSSKHSLVDIDTFVVAKNNLIFNADPSVMESYYRYKQSIKDVQNPPAFLIQIC